MRWFVASAAALVVLWAVYLASPFWAARDLALALEASDLARIESRVNFRALRISVARQIVAEALARKAALDVTGGSEAQLAASAAVIAAEPFLAEIVTPRGLVELVRAVRPGTPNAGTADRPDLGVRAWSQVPALLGASRWRGFRTVYLTLPPGSEASRQVRLQMRLSRLSWRLVALDLTPEARERMVADLLARRARGGAQAN